MLSGAGGPVVIGHRGARAVRPENTLEGIAYALSHGAVGVEIDVHLTSDGEIAVVHDPDLNPAIARGPDGRWLDTPGPRICETRFAALQAYDVGGLRPGMSYADAFPRQVAVAGARIPRLEDVMALCAGQDPAALLLIEIKSDGQDATLAAASLRCAEAVCARLNGHRLAASVIVQSFDWRVLARVAELAPGLARGYLTGEGGDGAPTFHPGTPWIDGRVSGRPPGMIAALGGTWWMPHHADIDAGGAAAARAAGLKLAVWTVNDAAELTRTATLGVDAVITDDPAQAAAAFGHPS